MEFKKTYHAMQVGADKKLEWVERSTPAPKLGQVLIAVEACGICGADLADIRNADTQSGTPRVPGHEVIGRIVAIGSQVSSAWKIGQRVGVGRLGGHCNECEQCRRGQFQLCQNQAFVGSTVDGGYAEMMLAKDTGLVAIPDELNSEEAAPILCAGLATFNALKKCGAEAGDTVVVFGIGGLGHMAIQYARKMGFRVLAVGRGSEIKNDALALGAHLYIDNNSEEAISQIKSVGGAKAIITTISDQTSILKLMTSLVPQGRLVVLGAGKDPLPVALGPLVVGERSLQGSITGTPLENEKTLQFSVLSGVRPKIEIMPLKKANEALQRLISGEVKFRMVLTMDSSK